MDLIRVLIIDAEKKEISEQFVSNSLDSMQKIVGGYIECAHSLSDGSEIYVNEEGLLKDGLIKGFNVFNGHQPFAGSAFVVAFDNDGNFASTKMGAKDLEMLVSFIEFKSWL
jgi:Domain of unknown function (DUF3846)